jgi:hypothetical protein
MGNRSNREHSETVVDAYYRCRHHFRADHTDTSATRPCGWAVSSPAG